MGKLCLRCSYERTDSDTAPEGECPRCGAIYARVEEGRQAAAAAAQARAAIALRNRRPTAEHGAAAFLTFGKMITPMLVTIVFIITVIANGVGMVYGVLAREPALIGGCLVVILVTRILLELVMVIFRISDDLAGVRELLADQAVQGSAAQRPATWS